MSAHLNESLRRAAAQGVSSLAELSGFIEGLAGVQGNQPARQDFLREVRLRARRIREIGWNIAVLAACTGSQDARDPLAKQLASRARALNADLFKTLAPIEDLMLGLPEAEFEQLMQDPLLGEEEYRLRHERRLQRRRLARVLVTDPGMGVVRHVDAGYDEALDFARSHDVRIPGRTTLENA